MTKPAIKTYASTFIYSKKDESGYNAEQALLNFILKADRIDKSSEAFKAVLNEIKVRQTTAVLYRILEMPNVIICIGNKELPASFKVFYAKDVRTDRSPKIFIDVTGLMKLVNGYFVCKEIDKLSAYLFGAMIHLMYNNNPKSIVSNSSIVESSTICFAKLFTGVLDNLRVINYADKSIQIGYISAVYYLYNIMGKDIDFARKSAGSILGLNPRDSSAYDMYYDEEKDMLSIDTFITFLANTFKMKGLSTDVYLSRWIMLYGKGTMYGLELLPAFLVVIANAYSGSYINNQKMIETLCGREMVNCATMLLRVGASEYEDGFNYGKL